LERIERFGAGVNDASGSERILIRKRLVSGGLVFPEEFFAVLDKADEDDDGRTGQADEKEDFEKAHGEDCEGHALILKQFSFLCATSKHALQENRA
jgi:hypothetical protein